MSSATRRRNLLALCVAAVLGLTAVLIAEGDAAAVQASDGYDLQRRQLDGDVRDAALQGYTRQDMAPVTDKIAAIDSAEQPVWVGERQAFYMQRSLAVRQLRVELRSRQDAVLADARTAAAGSLQAVRAALEHDLQTGVEEVDLRPLRGRLDRLGAGLPRTVGEYRAAQAEAGALEEDAQRLGAAQEAENAVLQQSAATLLTQTGGNLEALHGSGALALYNARNDATYAGFLNQAGTFSGFEALARSYHRLERYADQRSADPQAAALAAAAAIRYGSQVHDLLLKGMPARTILVSLSDQELRAFQDGRVVLDTVVTTGRPKLPTDVGPMKVLWKVSPWKMTSPWPKGSPFYYEPTEVRKVLWFTDSGEGLHDAPWRSWFGPGSNVGDGTHGCINMPGATVDFVFDWAPVGTPVIVIPGSGQPQAQQLAADTIDTAAADSPKGA